MNQTVAIIRRSAGYKDIKAFCRTVLNMDYTTFMAKLNNLKFDLPDIRKMLEATNVPFTELFPDGINVNLKINEVNELCQATDLTFEQLFCGEKKKEQASTKEGASLPTTLPQEDQKSHQGYRPLEVTLPPIDESEPLLENGAPAEERLPMSEQLQTFEKQMNSKNPAPGKNKRRYDRLRNTRYGIELYERGFANEEGSLLEGVDANAVPSIDVLVPIDEFEKWLAAYDAKLMKKNSQDPGSTPKAPQSDPNVNKEKKPSKDTLPFIDIGLGELPESSDSPTEDDFSINRDALRKAGIIGEEVKGSLGKRR